MESNICGIILNVSYDKMGNSGDIQVLGKTMHEWVSLSLANCTYTSTVDYTESVPLPILIRPYINKDSEFTVVLYSDTPLITQKTVVDAVVALKGNGQNVLKMTRGYVFKTDFILHVDKIYSDNTYYLDEEDFVTAFNFKQVAFVGDILKNRILTYHMDRGVHFEDLTSTFIYSDVVIGEGVTIAPNNILKGKTIIKDDVALLSGNVIDSCIIDSGATINSSQMSNSYIGEGTTVGPFAFIRPDSVIGPNCRIGDFVEIKKSIIGPGCKVAHLSYVGDCEMGSECNIGCGVVFVNYDGKNKFKTIVGDRVFVGSNSNIIAPMTIESGAFIAAGSTLTDDVPNSALAIARARQVNKLNWSKNQYKQPVK